TGVDMAPLNSTWTACYGVGVDSTSRRVAGSLARSPAQSGEGAVHASHTELPWRSLKLFSPPQLPLIDDLPISTPTDMAIRTMVNTAMDIRTVGIMVSLLDLDDASRRGWLGRESFPPANAPGRGPLVRAARLNC